jgi:hypothetical protein
MCVLCKSVMVVITVPPTTKNCVLYKSVMVILTVSPTTKKVCVMQISYGNTNSFPKKVCVIQISYGKTNSFPTTENVCVIQISYGNTNSFLEKCVLYKSVMVILTVSQQPKMCVLCMAYCGTNN